VHYNPFPASSVVLTNEGKTKFLMITWSKSCISGLNELQLPEKTNDAPQQAETANVLSCFLQRIPNFQYHVSQVYYFEIRMTFYLLLISSNNMLGASRQEGALALGTGSAASISFLCLTVPMSFGRQYRIYKSNTYQLVHPASGGNKILNIST
jgi:hypothetical protein